MTRLIHRHVAESSRTCVERGDRRAHLAYDTRHERTGQHLPVLAARDLFRWDVLALARGAEVKTEHHVLRIADRRGERVITARFVGDSLQQAIGFGRVATNVRMDVGVDRVRQGAGQQLLASGEQRVDADGARVRGAHGRDEARPSSSSLEQLRCAAERLIVERHQHDLVADRHRAACPKAKIERAAFDAFEEWQLVAETMHREQQRQHRRHEQTT